MPGWQKNLAHAKGQLPAGGSLDIEEVSEDTLGGLRAQIDSILSVLRDALEGLEHEVELTDIGKIVLAAGGAGDHMLLNKLFHLVLGEGVHGLAQVKLVLLGPLLNDFICAEPLLALLAVHQRVGEAAHMAGGHPDLGVHEDGGVQAHVVGVLLDELLPPGLFHVVLQLHAQGAVIPGISQAAIDLAACENEAAAFAQGHDFLHGLFRVLHDDTLLTLNIDIVGQRGKK